MTTVKKAKVLVGVLIAILVGMVLKEIVLWAMAPKVELVKSHVNDSGVFLYIASEQLDEDIDTVLHKTNAEAEAILRKEEMEDNNIFGLWE